MLKIGNLALLALLGHSATAQDCTGAISTMLDTCDYATFLAEIDATCNKTEFAAFEAEFDELCREDAITQFVEIQGTYQLDRRYFHGGGPLVDGGNFKVDAAQIQRFEANSGSSTVIGWPDYAARKQYNVNTGQAGPDEANPNGYPANMNLDAGCELKTAMCCFADDGTSEGFPGFDASGDVITDVCHHDHELSPESNFIEEGWQVMPGSEGPVHCVGFTWTEGDDELLGNMMYDVSLRNTALKGYTKGIPGAPLCGCVEHMPVVEEAACKTATLTGEVKYTVHYDGEVLSITNAADVTYGPCPAGDLKAQVIANDATAADAISEHLVGKDGCAAELQEYLNEEQYLAERQSARYLFPDPAKWSELVVGEGTNFLPPDLDPVVADERFRGFLNAGCVDENGAPRACIIRRTCGSCQDHYANDLYYRRFSALPTPEEMTALVDNRAQLDYMTLLYLFTDEWVKDYNDMAAGDFRLYSTYEDALADENAWTYCNYGNYDGYGFPRNCGPSGGTHNWNSYVRRGGGWAEHHGFYVELP